MVYLACSYLLQSQPLPALALGYGLENAKGQPMLLANDEVFRANEPGSPERQFYDLMRAAAQNEAAARQRGDAKAAAYWDTLRLKYNTAWANLIDNKLRVNVIAEFIKEFAKGLAQFGGNVADTVKAATNPVFITALALGIGLVIFWPYIKRIL